MNPLRLAWLRLRRGATGMGATAALVAVAGAGMLLVASIGVRVQQAVAQQAIEALSGSDSYTSVSYDGTDARLDTMRSQAHVALDVLAPGAPISQYATFRPMWDGAHSTYQLAGSSQLASEVSLTEGRFPHTCTPQVCEVVALDDGHVQVDALGLRVVGRGQWTGQPAVVRALDPSATLLLAGDPLAMTALPTMAAVARSWLWAAPLDAVVIAGDPQGWLDRVGAQSAAVTRADGRLVLAAPDAAITRATAQGASVRRRLQGLGLALALISVAGAWLGAWQNRTRIRAAATVARQYATGVRVPVLPDIAVPVVAGRLAGAAVALIACAAADVPWPPLAGWVASGAAALACISVGWSAVTDSRVLRAVLGAATAAWCMATAAALQVTGTLATACLAGGVAGATTAVLATRTTGAPVRRALAANNRGVVTAAATVVAMACATGSAAMTQGQMLNLNASDHAAFASPLAARVTALEQTPTAALTLGDYRAWAGGAFPIARLPATAHSGMLDAAAVQVLGVPAGALAALPDLRHQTGVDPRVLVGGRARTDPAALPDGPITVTADGIARNVDVRVWVRDADGRLTPVDCVPGAPGTCVIDGGIPRSPAVLEGIELAEHPSSRARREHAAGEGAHDVTAPHGTLHVTMIAVAGRNVDAALWPGLGAPADYDLASGPAYTAARSTPTQARAIVDPLTAATAVDGQVSLRLGPATVITATVAAVAQRFPTAPPRFAVVELTALTDDLATRDPSQLVLTDVWLTGPLSAAAHDQVRGHGLAVVTRDGVLRTMSSDVGTAWTRRGIALVLALMLAMCLIVALGLAGDIRRRTPLVPWLNIGLPASDYVRAGTAITLVATGAAAVTASLAAVPVTTRVEQALGVDATGALAVPALAASVPTLALAVMATVCVTAVTTMLRAALVPRDGNR